MNIVIVAGEVSGDLLGGKLATELINLNTQITISGIGGQTMREAGVQTLFDVNESALTRYLGQTKEKLALLPKSVRKRSKTVRDDF